MVFNTAYKNSLKELILDDFDNILYMAPSDDTSEELASSDSLTDEIAGLRKANDEQVKDTTLFTYEWDAVWSLTEGNGESFAKVGLFTGASGDNLKISKLLTEAIAKTSAIELNVGVMVSVTTTEVDVS